MRSNHPTRLKAAGAAVACGAIGVIAGITGAAAAPTPHPARASRHAAASSAAPPARRRLGGPAVHEDAVVLNKAGTGFIAATMDNGTVKSVSGDSLTISEGVGTVTYKTVTLTIPSGASVERNFKTASLSDLKSADHVHVTQSSEGTEVLALDSTFRPWGPPNHAVPHRGFPRGAGPGPGGPGPGGPWGPDGGGPPPVAG